MPLNLRYNKSQGPGGRRQDRSAGRQNIMGIGIILILTVGMIAGISELYGRADWSVYSSYIYVNTVPSEAPVEPEPEPMVSDEELALLKTVEEKMEDGRFQEAARILNNHEEEFRTLFYETLDRKPCLYRDGVITDRLEGEGLVLKKSNKVFYGTFADELPQGELTALQAVVYETPRYDYSIGVWKDGCMEGDGVTGYCYYDGADVNEAVEVEKKGRFHQNLLDGEMVYRSRNAAGEVCSWVFEASEGVTVLDDRWSFDEETNEYHLLSEEDSTHALTISRDEAGQAKWGNTIIWQ